MEQIEQMYGGCLDEVVITDDTVVAARVSFPVQAVQSDGGSGFLGEFGKAVGAPEWVRSPHALPSFRPA